MDDLETMLVGGRRRAALRPAPAPAPSRIPRDPCKRIARILARGRARGPPPEHPVKSLWLLNGRGTVFDATQCVVDDPDAWPVVVHQEIADTPDVYDHKYPTLDLGPWGQLVAVGDGRVHFVTHRSAEE